MATSHVWGCERTTYLAQTQVVLEHCSDHCPTLVKGCAGHASDAAAPLFTDASGDAGDAKGIRMHTS